MLKILVSGRGGSGKSTIVTLLGKVIGERGRVLVVDTDESNLGLGVMLGQDQPDMTLMQCLGGKSAVKEKLFNTSSETVGIFADGLQINDIPEECLGGKWPVRYLRIGKIEHSLEGCACPMGALARSFLKNLTVGENDWVLVDTEAGVEHFGRGVLEGVDLVLFVVDPTHEAVLLVRKANRLAEEMKKDFWVVLNKVDDKTEPFLRSELAKAGIRVAGSFAFSPEIVAANLTGDELPVGVLHSSLADLATDLRTRALS